MEGEKNVLPLERVDWLKKLQHRKNTTLQGPGVPWLRKSQSPLEQQACAQLEDYLRDNSSRQVRSDNTELMRQVHFLKELLAIEQKTNKVLEGAVIALVLMIIGLSIAVTH